MHGVQRHGGERGGNFLGQHSAGVRPQDVFDANASYGLANIASAVLLDVKIVWKDRRLLRNRSYYTGGPLVAYAPAGAAACVAKSAVPGAFMRPLPSTTPYFSEIFRSTSLR